MDNRPQQLHTPTLTLTFRVSAGASPLPQHSNYRLLGPPAPSSRRDTQLTLRICRHRIQDPAGTKSKAAQVPSTERGRIGE